MDNNEIFIKKLILHILDSNLGLPVISQTEHPLDHDINDFISKHISKVLKDNNLKEAEFINENSSILQSCKKIDSDFHSFADATIDIAEKFYSTMTKFPDIPSADLICCLFYIDEKKYFGLFKFNYKYSYIHHVQESDSGRLNSIIKQKTTLPNENQKIDECAIISLEDYKILLLEKKYLLDDQKDYYISNKILNCKSDLSDKQKTKIIKDVSKNIIKNYYDNDVNKLAELKKEVSHSLESDQEIDIQNVVDKVFHNEDLTKVYLDEVKEKGIKEKVIKIDKSLKKNYFKKQKLVTDTGIEISFPIEYADETERIEFINNIDGSISILIKNISNIKDK